MNKDNESLGGLKLEWF